MKRGLVLLVSFIFLLSILSIAFTSSEENPTQVPTLQQPVPVSTIKCSIDSDCDSSSLLIYCSDSNVCVYDISFFCQNAGTTDSFCNTKKGGGCYPCQYGCKDEKCIPQPPSAGAGGGGATSDYCTDPDGINHFIAGKTCTNTGCELDKCEGNTIIEYTCKDNKPAVDHTYSCIKGCQEGACLPETTTTPTSTNCVQRGNSCCKADVCEILLVCEEGYTTVLKGCDVNCKSIVSCQPIAQEQVKEQVKCVFANSKTQQECYLAGYNDKFSCSGTESCVMSVDGYRNQQLTWKSTCGGYAYTTIDGADDYAKFECLTQETTPTPTIPSTEPPVEIYPAKKPAIPYALTWYRIAYWQCYDNVNDKQGGETSCKPAEVWKKYADEFCNNHCDKETGKCGVNSFGVYSECSGDTIIATPVCGNGICESGEGEICTIKKRVVCTDDKPCETSTARCDTACAKDCKKTKEKEIFAKLNEKFNLGVSQAAVFDYQSLKINFNNLFIPPCQAEQKEEKATATIEKYETMTGKVISGFATTSEETTTTQTTQTETNCLAEPYAVLQLKYLDKNGKSKTDVIKIRVGEKKQVFDFVISFLDYERDFKQGVFLVFLADSETTPQCPENCICNIYGNIKECKKIEKCEEGKGLCPDGVCRDKCEIEDITTECKFGCFYQDKCLPYGLRVNGLYCSISNDMKSQLTADEVCENNFECSTNVCVDGKCVSSGLIQKIIEWFSKLFGG